LAASRASIEHVFDMFLQSRLECDIAHGLTGSGPLSEPNPAMARCIPPYAWGDAGQISRLASLSNASRPSVSQIAGTRLRVPARCEVRIDQDVSGPPSIRNSYQRSSPFSAPNQPSSLRHAMSQNNDDSASTSSRYTESRDGGSCCI